MLNHYQVTVMQIDTKFVYAESKDEAEQKVLQNFRYSDMSSPYIADCKEIDSQYNTVKTS